MNPLTSERKILKLNNHLIWRYIKQLVVSMKLEVKFAKVKAHSAQDWCKRNHTIDVTSATKSKWDAYKLKSLNHILPCGDILQKHYPLLHQHLQGRAPCPVCFLNDDINSYLGFCLTLQPILDNLLCTLRCSLCEKLHAAVPDNICTYFLDQELINLPLFGPVLILHKIFIFYFTILSHRTW